MQVEEIKLHEINKLLADYKAGIQTVTDKFDYLPYEKESYIEKADELKKRVFKRNDLAEVLTEMNRKWNAPSAVMENINRLKDEKSMVVIGGQQAGILTGPIYTIHKIISLVHLAKMKEKELQLPIIPVFWIAGEDHDFDEVNHIFLSDQGGMKKHTINQYVAGKKTVSNLELDKQAAHKWLVNVFMQFEETVFTKGIYDHAKEAIESSVTYVDFFARLITELFGDSGLVLVDSGNKDLRKLESDYFQKMIEKQPYFSKGVYKEVQKNMKQGYSAILDIKQSDSHLFYHLNNERILLSRDEKGNWIGKQGEISFSSDELMKIASARPELLSNNVVTRPVMQELLFPSLAFIGGPGEVAYWSVLKPVFQAMECRMPIVLPRMSFTLVDRKAAKQLDDLTLDAAEVVNYGLAREKGNWINAQHNPPITTLAEEVRKAVERAHFPLRDMAGSISSDMGELAEKNLSNIKKEIMFLSERLNGTLKQKHAVKLAVFDQLEFLLYPFSGLQERTWNIFPWLNRYGKDFLYDLTEEDFNLEADHYLVYL